MGSMFEPCIRLGCSTTARALAANPLQMQPAGFQFGQLPVASTTEKLNAPPECG
jgi:hypothetical protein